MAKTRKEYRELTVSKAVGYSRKPAPMLRIQGRWLQELGFNPGDPILVKCEDGKLIITLDQARAEAMEQEKVFIEEETRKLELRYQKEKKELRCGTANYLKINVILFDVFASHKNKNATLLSCMKVMSHFFISI
jgi:toxic protein SymE